MPVVTFLKPGGSVGQGVVASKPPPIPPPKPPVAQRPSQPDSGDTMDADKELAQAFG